jgi:[citrate (pro-3S)-lyase] ligase
MFPYDLEVIPLEKLNASYRIDAVVLTPLMEREDSVNIEERIKRRIDCDVLSLDNDLIVEIDLIDCMKEVIEYVCRSGARIMFIDVHDKLMLRIKNPSAYEQLLAYCGKYFERYLLKFPNVLNKLYDDIEYYSEEYFREISTYEQIERDGAVYLRDGAGFYRNIVGGRRITTDVPDKYNNTIYVYGPCWIMGRRAEDKHTIQSHLQRILNNNANHIGRVFRVVNCGVAVPGYEYNAVMRMMQERFVGGDIVIFITYDISGLKFFNPDDSDRVLFCDISAAFDRPHEFGEIFLDWVHWGHKGNKLVADLIYKVLGDFGNRPIEIMADEKNHAAQIITGSVLPESQSKNVCDDLPCAERSDELDDYLSFLESQKADAEGVIGAVVMNCNPFTLGHRYLIEKASAECGFLYVFVVEEDKSEYSFNDRIALVEKGVSDIGSVKVLPSGKFIISTLTLPEYFEKSKKITIDATYDIDMFARHIAPVLNISKRFVGDEPTCYITRQYNQAMKDILPKHGIEFIVFQRKEFNGIPVSASIVREHIKNGKYEDIKNLVPESTYEFLTLQQTQDF